jgi:uncharacterized phage protein (TIGR02218 family)
MRTLPESLRAALASGVTTHCRCWAVTRTDGVVLGFTDHDRPLSFEGISFEASSGLNAEAVESSTGLSVDSHTVTGALSSEAITDEDIERGFYDGAEVTLWLVDWMDVESRLLLSRGQIGEIRRGKAAFEAEVVGLSERLNQPTGRAYVPACDRRLGDAKCGVDLGQPAYRGTALVQTVIDLQRFSVSGLDGFERGWFNGGRLEWTSGDNAGVDGHVKTYLTPAGGAIVELWLSPPLPVQPGDGFTVTAGCDKRMETCKAKFNNLLNFRGFPHMPGDDWAAGYVKQEGEHDGGSLFRR